MGKGEVRDGDDLYSTARPRRSRSFLNNRRVATL